MTGQPVVSDRWSAAAQPVVSRWAVNGWSVAGQWLVSQWLVSCVDRDSQLRLHQLSFQFRGKWVCPISIRGGEGTERGREG